MKKSRDILFIAIAFSVFGCGKGFDLQSQSITFTSPTLEFHLDEPSGATQIIESIQGGNANGFCPFTVGASSVQCPTTGVPGRFNNAIKLTSGTGFKGSVPISIGFNTVSIGLLVRGDGTAQAGGLFGIQTNGQFAVALGICGSGSGNSSGTGACVLVINNTGQTAVFGYSNQAISDGSWHYVVLTTDYTSQNTLLYIDGAFANYVNAGAQSVGVIPSGTFQFGGPASGGNNSLNGVANVELDEVSVFNSVLSSTEVAARYANFSP